MNTDMKGEMIRPKSACGCDPLDSKGQSECCSPPNKSKLKLWIFLAIVLAAASVAAHSLLTKNDTAQISTSSPVIPDAQLQQSPAVQPPGEPLGETSAPQSESGCACMRNKKTDEKPSCGEAQAIPSCGN